MYIVYEIRVRRLYTYFFFCSLSPRVLLLFYIRRRRRRLLFAQKNTKYKHFMRSRRRRISNFLTLFAWRNITVMLWKYYTSTADTTPQRRSRDMAMFIIPTFTRTHIHHRSYFCECFFFLILWIIRTSSSFSPSPPVFHTLARVERKHLFVCTPHVFDFSVDCFQSLFRLCNSDFRRHFTRLVLLNHSYFDMTSHSFPGRPDFSPINPHYYYYYYCYYNYYARRPVYFIRFRVH